MVRTPSKGVRLVSISLLASSSFVMCTVPVTHQLVEQWIENEKAIICTTEQRTSKFTTICSLWSQLYIHAIIHAVTVKWKPVYFRMLLTYYNTRLVIIHTILVCHYYLNLILGSLISTSSNDRDHRLHKVVNWLVRCSVVQIIAFSSSIRCSTSWWVTGTEHITKDDAKREIRA